MSKFKDELNLDMKRYNVYQLLYRNGLINHKNETIQEQEQPIQEPVTETTTDDSEDGIAISLGPVDEQWP